MSKTKTETVEKAGTVIDPNTGEVIDQQPSAGNMPVRARTQPLTLGGTGPTRVGSLMDAKPEDYNFPKLHLFQGTQYEKKAYGDKTDGTWIDAVTCESIDVEDKIKVVPVFGFKNVAVYRVPFGAGFVGLYDNVLDIPEEYRANSNEFDVIRQLNWVVLVENADYPMIIVFRLTGYRMGQSFAAMIDGRAAYDKPLGAYHLQSRMRSGPKGDSFLPVVVPAGDAPDEMRDLAEKFAVAFSGGQVVPQDVAEVPVEDGGEGGVPE